MRSESPSARISPMAVWMNVPVTVYFLMLCFSFRMRRTLSSMRCSVAQGDSVPVLCPRVLPAYEVSYILRAIY